MSDLTERLRELAACKATFGGDAEAFAVAADEIDRLTRELAEARDTALEEAALRIDCNCNERCLASHEGYCPKQTVAAIRALKEKP